MEVLNKYWIRDNILPDLFQSAEGYKDENNQDIDKNSYFLTLFEAVKRGDDDKVSLLLQEKGFDIDLKELSSGRTALHEAVMNEQELVVKLLLENGADIEAKNSHGSTALVLAAFGGEEQIVKLLLENGADIEAKNSSGLTALLMAIPWNEVVIKLLLERGADTEVKDEEEGQTPLHSTVKRKSHSAAKLLLATGADTEAKDEKAGGTALHWAADLGDILATQDLLEAGADIEAKTRKQEAQHSIGQHVKDAIRQQICFLKRELRFVRRITRAKSHLI
ncbi:MAG: hypothetical protein M1814_001865 [Vezdaea aestivalis]|nr:MAG: hypothetical protein M1814_001865 [Vezdaea aestivalis]